MKTILTLFAFLLPTLGATAQVGTLDPDFGEGGVQTSHFKAHDFMYDVALEADGHIVVVGLSDNNSPNTRDAQVARYLPDGTLEASWTYSHGAFGCSSVPEEFRAVAIQPDGLIVAGGYEQNDCGGPQRDFRVVRYRTNGGRDATFARPFLKGGTDYLEDLVIQSDGKILAAGYAKNLSADNSDYDVALVRYRADGTLDPTFGGNGEVMLDVFGGYDYAVGLALQPDGKILVTGYGDGGGQTDIFILRFAPDGSLDESFGTSGVVTLDVEGLNDGGRAIAVQADGKIVVAGNRMSSPDSVQAMLAVRYLEDGSLDAGFGNGGLAVVEFGGTSSMALDLTLLENGKIMLGGFAGDESAMDFALVRLNADGSLDGSFGSAGIQTTDFAGQLDQARGMAVQPDGQIVLAGLAEAGDGGVETRDAALARYVGDAAPLIVQPNPSISGRVTAGGSGLAGVAMQLSGGSEQITHTDAEGYYFFPNLPPGESYSVVPHRAEAQFDPTSASLSAIETDTTVNFSATLSPLSGVYTLGGDDPDFHSFAEAASALLQQGVVGPVTFNVRAGHYTEGADIALNIPSQIEGVSETNRVTFQATGGVAVDEIVLERLSPSGGSFGGAVAQVASDYVTLRGITFRVRNEALGRNALSRAVQLTRTGSNAELDGMIVEGCVVDGGGIVRDGIWSGDSSRDLAIRDNAVDMATQSIVVTNGVRPVVENNRLTGMSTFRQSGSVRGIGLAVSNSSEPIVRGNVLDYSGTDGQTGITITNAANYVLEGNQVVNVNTGGIYGSFTGIAVSTFNRGPTVGLIVNNMVSVNTPRRTGIQVTGSSQGGDDVLVAHNTVYLPPRGIDHFGGSRAYAMRDSRNAGFRVMNNIFVDRATGSSYVMDVDTTGNWFDHNLLYSATNRLVTASGASYNDLTAWKSTGYGAHSVSFMPEVVSVYSDLHLADSEDGNTDLIGLPLADVLLDIDRQERSTELPYLGADELSAFSGGRPIAREDVATTFEETAVQIGVLENDLDLDGGSLKVHTVTQAIGSVAIDPDSLSITYTPEAGFYGRDRFTYTVRNEAGLPDEGSVVVNVLPKPADLTVTSVEAPPEAFSGQSIDISWTVTNTAEGATSAPQWYDRVWLSRNENGSDGISLGSPKNLTYLRSGESYTNTATFTLPNDPEEGQYYAFVHTDYNGHQAESDEENNHQRSETTVDLQLTEPPDLQVTALTVPDNSFSGESVTVNWTVANEGLGATSGATWLDVVYGTPNADLSGARSLAQRTHEGALAPQESYEMSASVSLPNGFSGPYYIFVHTDTQNRVFESVLENNNRRLDSVQVALTPPPDLVPTAVQAVEEVQSGQQIAVSWTVENQGAGSPFEAKWYDRIYLSPSAELDLEDAVVLANVQQSTAFGPNETYEAQRSVRLPNGISGTYYLFVLIDANGDVFEHTFEENNVLRSGELVVSLAPSPDLSPSDVVVPDVAAAGASFAVVWSVPNTGEAAATGEWIDRAYLSTSDTWSEGSAQSLARVSRDRNVPAGASYESSANVTLPTNLASGTYYVYVMTDAEDRVYEHEAEANNVGRSAAIQIEAYPPVDLRVSTLSIPDSAGSGEAITVSWSVENAGGGRTLTGRWTDAVYLSPDDELNAASDELLGRFERRGELDGGARYDRTQSLTLPESIEGDYFIFVQTDERGGVAEDDDANNVGGGGDTLRVTRTVPPDLRITELNVSSPGQAGQPITVRWTIRNDGTGTTPDTSWFEAIYLSRYQTLDNSATRIGTYTRNGTLAPDSAYTDSLDVQIPSYASGAYYVLVQTDSRNDLFEAGGESNNLAVVPVTIVLPVPSDLIVKAVSAPADVVPGEEVTINYTVENVGSNAAVGRMVDAVYVSNDANWDLEDPLVGLQTRSVNLEPGATMKMAFTTALDVTYRADALGNITEIMPGVAPGSYYFIARTDVRGNLREDDETNNSGASPEVTEATVPLLAPGALVESTLPPDSRRFFRVEVPSDRDVRLELEDDHPEEQTVELLTAHEAVPSRSSYARGIVEPGVNRVIYLPSSASGTHYVMLYNPTQQELGFTVAASELGFEVADVVPSVVGNDGAVTLEIQGGQMSRVARVLLRGDGLEIEAPQLRLLDATRLLARFDLSFAPLGTYTVVAIDGDGAETGLGGGIEVEHSTGMRASMYQSGPGRVRRGNTGRYVLYLRNTGNVNIPHGLLSFLIHQDAAPSIELENVGAPDLSAAPALPFEPDPHAFTESGNARLLPLYVSELRPNESMTLTFAMPLVATEQYFTLHRLVPLSDSMFVEQQGWMAEHFRKTILANDAFAGTALADLAAIPEAFSDVYLDAFREMSPRLADSGRAPDEIPAEPRVHYLMEEGYAVTARLAEQYAASVAPENVLPAGPDGGALAAGAFADAGPASASAANNAASALANAGGCSCNGGDGSPVPFVFGGMNADCAMLADYYGDGSCDDPPPASFDPNDIIGPAGFGDERWIPVSQNLPYTIRFENDAEKATADAQVVTIQQQLDETLDLRTFRLGTFGFRGFTFEVPENRSYYQTRLDVRDSLGLFVDYTAGVDITTGEAFWILKAIDPATGELPVFDGFLPPNDTLGMGTGEGFVTYTISVRSDAATRDVVDAEAQIVFDINEPIDTPPIFNTIDAEAPISMVLQLPEELEQQTFEISWSRDDFGGSDAGSYTLYMATDGGPFEAHQRGIADTTTVFTGEYGKSYDFFVVAVDHAGNAEAMKSGAEASVRLVTPTGTEDVAELPKEYALNPNYPNPFNPATTLSFALPEAAEVTVEVFDVIGRRVTVLVRDERPAGRYDVRFDASEFASGVYFYRMQARGLEGGRRFTDVRKMVFVK